LDGNVASLVKSLDTVVGQNKAKGMSAFVVLLSDSPQSTEGTLKSVAKSKGISSTPLTTFDGVTGPPSYNISKDAEVTVLMWVGGKITVSEELKASDLTAAKINSLVGKTSTILN
jgi:CTP:molybdopterin cytidylyltransferase MocA